MPCTLLCPASRFHGAIFGQVLGPARPVWSKAPTCHDLDILRLHCDYMLLESHGNHGNMWELQFFLFELLVRNGLNEGECQLGSFAIVAPPTSQTERFISDKLHHKLQTFLGAACHAQPQSQVPLYSHPVHQLRSCLSDNSHFCKCGKVQHMDRQ